ncbi:MAG: hypothetical protein AUH30_21100 [Candidatus Rokubacteria bacterium 13_1_40CM_68_15]|nr:MAG: hypothetical protein AUH30_21100 [Candidatus Rokubacteria bacterium 13_1_40CM_68_15]
MTTSQPLPSSGGRKTEAARVASASEATRYVIDDGTLAAGLIAASASIRWSRRRGTAAAEGKSRDNKTRRDSLGGRSRFEAGPAFIVRTMPRSFASAKRNSAASCSGSTTSTACRVAGTALVFVRSSSYTT